MSTLVTFVKKSYSSSIRNVILAVGVLLLAFLMPWLLKGTWLEVISTIRTSIVAGDSGHLILAAATVCTILSLVSSAVFIHVNLLLAVFKKHYKLSERMEFLAKVTLFLLLYKFICQIYILPFEWVSVVMSLAHLLFVFHHVRTDLLYLSQLSFITIQVFFAYQWLNVIPLLSGLQLGKSDVFYSIKLSSQYLNNETVLNFAGSAFFFPVFMAAIATGILFKVFEDNMKMAEANYTHEREMQALQAKVLENRIYQEVNLLAHDLKTPLVTIKGLSSLLQMSHDQSVIDAYALKIEQAVSKMSEMVSSFLYSESRQEINPKDLMTYISAQVPLQDEKLQLYLSISEELPIIRVNKVRVVRALINIIENAIVAPCTREVKVINVNLVKVNRGIHIEISDNGTGIDEGILNEIWQIGYSTKKSSGLGLPFAKQIIEENLGDIDLKSSPMNGTTVTVFLPSVKLEDLKGE